MFDPSTAERRILAVLLGLWLFCALATASTLLRGTGLPPLFVTSLPSPSGAPEVSGFRSDPTAGDTGELQIGDRLLRVSDGDLRGAGPITFFAIFAEQSRYGATVEVEFERDGQRRTTTVVPGSTALFLPLLLASPVFAAVALLLWFRAPTDPSARFFAACFMTLGFFMAGNFFGSRVLTFAAMGVHLTTMTLIGPLSIYAARGFARPTASTDRQPLWPLVFAVLGPLHSAHFGGPVPPHIGIPAAALVVVALFSVELILITRTYRRTDRIGRRRIKWAFLGFYCGAVPPIAAGLLAAALPSFVPVYYVSLAAVACIPIAFLVAIFRFNLFDIDRVISATGSYNLLLLAAITIGVLVVPRTAEAGAALLGVESWLLQVGVTVPLALFLLSVHRRLRPQIDRIFFSERYALDTGVQGLLEDLRQTTDVATLIRGMAEELVRLIRPESCRVYARDSTAYTPVFAYGGAGSPVLAVDGPLDATIREKRRPLVLAQEERTAALDPFERAVLETLDAVVVIPLRRGADLSLLLCLGRKRSGDVYTPTDIQLLERIGDAVSAHLSHLEQIEVIRQIQDRQDALRRYVPAPVAEVLDRGGELQPAERDITVLFVDLRGYTSLCEPLRPEEIFTTVNRYTDAISWVIRQHGGTIVEFSGDGLMAIFGAPTSQADKEVAAVRAARELVRALRSLDAPAPDNPLTVGVGIATGPALCGNVRAAENVIWTAVGNIVNLAARLQSLTREIDAVIVIDAATYALAGPVAADFRLRENVSIRGRSEPENVYVLPLTVEAAAA